MDGSLEMNECGRNQAINIDVCTRNQESEEGLLVVRFVRDVCEDDETLFDVLDQFPWGSKR
jgi:hypothetical protein